MRGLSISDDSLATAWLERIGYFRLSGYWYSLRASQPNAAPGQKAKVLDDFRPGTQFSHVISLYLFDKQLRLLVLDGIERLEVALRTDIVLHLGAHSPLAHREPGFLNRDFAVNVDSRTGVIPHQDWLKRLDKLVKRSHDDFAKHFRATYNTPLPIWVAAELWDFGMLSHFLSGMRYHDLTVIAAKYGLPRNDLLTGLVRSINSARNICAHHGRLWNRNLSSDQPTPPRSGEVPLLEHLVSDNHAQRRLYGVLAGIRHLLRAVNPHTEWGARLGALIDKFPIVPGISTRHMGFPAGWQSYDLWP